MQQSNLLVKQKMRQPSAVLQQIVSFGAGEGIARGFNWATMALLPLLLTSSEEYGRVGLLVSIEMLVANVSLMGLDRAVLRFYAKDELPSKLLKSVLVIWAGFAWIPLAAVLIFYLFGWKTLFGIPLAPHLFLLSAIVAIFNLNSLCVGIGRARQNLSIFYRFRLIYVALKFVLVLALAKVLGHSLSYVIGIGISALVMLIFILPFLLRSARERADCVIISKILMFGWPFVFHIISGNILSYFSLFFLEVYNTTQDVGIFMFALTLGNGLYIIYAVLSTYFEPRIYSHADEKANCEKWLTFYTNACISLASAGGACLLFFYPYFVQYLDADYWRALPTISMIMGTVLLTPLYLQGNYRLTAHTKTGYIATSSLICACLSIGLNYILIPRYGILGAAFAMYISNFALCAFILIASIRIAQIPLRHLYSLPLYGVCVTGSLSVILLANKTEMSILMLMVVFLTTSGLLVHSFIKRVV